MAYRQSGPSPLVIIIFGALLVFGGYYVWTGFLRFLEDRGDITAQVTREAQSTVIAQSVTPRPTIFVPATFTPLPPCQMFMVYYVDRAAYRDCPSEDNQRCPPVDVLVYGTEVCVYARAPENPEWYVIDLNPEGAYREIVFIHESVLKAMNPTPVPSMTFTPLPTVSPLPSNTPTPSPVPSPTQTVDPASTPLPTPTPALPTPPPEVIV